MITHPFSNWTDHPLSLAKPTGLFGFRDEQEEVQLYPSLAHFILASGFRGSRGLVNHILEEPTAKEAYSFSFCNRHRLDSDFFKRLPKILYCGLLFVLDQVVDAEMSLASPVHIPSSLSTSLFLGELDISMAYSATLARAMEHRTNGWMRVAIAGGAEVEDAAVRSGLKWAFSRRRPDYVLLAGARAFDQKVEAWARKTLIPVVRHKGADSATFHEKVDRVVSRSSHLLIIGESSSGYTSTLQEKSKDAGITVKFAPIVPPIT